MKNNLKGKERFQYQGSTQTLSVPEALLGEYDCALLFLCIVFKYSLWLLKIKDWIQVWKYSYLYWSPHYTHIKSTRFILRPGDITFGD